jgi:radical SAM superfamily enzyme YgiQ (UPF0313 family)
MAEQLRIKLIHCGNRNISDVDDNMDKHVFYMPMGLLSLGSCLEERNFDVELIHLDLEADFDIDSILDLETLDAAGLAWHWVNQSIPVLSIAESIKKINPGIFIFAGGYTASFFAREILENYLAFDAVIRGDGEQPIVELCEILKEWRIKNEWEGDDFQSSLHTIQNLAWRNSKGKVMLNKLSYIASARELDDFDFDKIDLLRNWMEYRNMSRFWSKFSIINDLPLYFLEVGRGCCYNCLICGGNAGAQLCLNNRRQQSVRSVESVISSIQQGISFGYSLFLSCFEFEGANEWYIDLFRKIRQKRLRLSFAYESWGLLSKELVDEISRTCNHAVITISPDTSDPDLRKKNKDSRLFYDNAELEGILDYIGTKKNVKVQLYFGFFYPFDTPKTIFNTIEYISKLFHKYSDFTEMVYMNNDTDPASAPFLNPEKYDMDIEVGCLNDYMKKIRENFILAKGECSGKTLLSKPRCMSDEEAVDLANTIIFFNRILSFKKSVIKILKITQKINIFSDFLRRYSLISGLSEDFQWEKARDVLFKICERHIGINKELIDQINREYYNLATRRQSRNFTDFFKVPDKLAKLSEQKKKKISRDIQNVRKNIQAEFDI